jgi:nucleoside-diphosphate-sugar epimerase
MTWSGRTVLVTGAAGFVGSHLARRLAASGATVHGLLRPTSNACRVPPTVTVERHDGSTGGAVAILERVRPDVVFHLAARFVAQHEPADVEGLVRDNVLLLAQLVEAMVRGNSHRLVNTGTAWQHGGSTPDAPATLYAATKQAAEAVLSYYVDASPLRVVTLKLHDTYGPDDPREKLFTLLARASARATPLSMSPGDQLLQLVHVDDVCDAFLMVGERLLRGEIAGHDTYAVAAEQQYSLREVVELYASLCGRPLQVSWGGRAYRPREVMVPWEGPRVPGWRPRIALADGLRALIRS